MKVVSWNVNGLRSVIKKGFLAWLEQSDIDVLCLQETKMPNHLAAPQIPGWFMQSLQAERSGYSGVAIYAREPITQVEVWKHPVMQSEGRIMAVAFRDFWIVNVYLPSGTSGAIRQAIKMELLPAFQEVMQPWLARKTLVVGDFNIAHQAIDLYHWRSNQKNSGFLPEERAWLDAWTQQGWVDTFRHLYPDRKAYTWWSMRAKTARLQNIGWRIDYQFASQAAASLLRQAWIDESVTLSDHAPYGVEYQG